MKISVRLSLDMLAHISTQQLSPNIWFDTLQVLKNILNTDRYLFNAKKGRKYN